MKILTLFSVSVLIFAYIFTSQLDINQKMSNLASIIFANPTPNSNSFYIMDGGTSSTCTNWSDACDALPDVLQRGAVYYIADGTYSGYNFDDPISGADYFFIKKATVDNHGTESGWQNSLGDGVAQFTAPINFSTSFVVFDGVVGGGKNGHGFEVYISEQANTSTTGIFIRGDNVEILHTKVYWPDGAANNEIFHQPLANMGISVYKEFVTTNPGTGDGYYPPIQNITLSYLYLNEIPGSFMGFQAEPRNVLVEHSVFDKMYSDSRSCCHGSALIARGNSSNITVRYNTFKDISGSTGGITLYNNGTSSARHFNWNIYGNVFFQGNPGHGVITDNRQAPGIIIKENINIFNNDFVGHAQYGGVSFQNDTTNVRVFNNLFDNQPYLTMFGITDRGHNYYSDVPSWFGFTPLTSSNENFFVSDEPIVNASAGDFSLKLGSPAVDAGVDICTIVDCLASPMLRYDAKGNPRGADGLWDIGAYEYSIAMPPVTNSTTTATTTVVIIPTPELVRGRSSGGGGSSSKKSTDAIKTAPKKGDKNSSVNTLQTFLISQKFLTLGSKSGQFDKSTEEAIKKFQTKYKYKPTGKLDKLTLAKINQLIAAGKKLVPIPVNKSFTRTITTVGSRGADVKALQVFLNNEGFPITKSGPGSRGLESDYFGQLTKNALAKWQKSVGLPATGVVDAATMTRLNTLVK